MLVWKATKRRQVGVHSPAGLAAAFSRHLTKLLNTFSDEHTFADPLS